ncbi:WD40-repeat-containing domain protein [Flagelloscypha sp. PMI_526]|nr:WD40-repeat-containing domain protein [Flagelloscypha sp. PMI_526]
MSEPTLGVPDKLVSPEVGINQTKPTDSRPLCILTLDGGIPGTTESSQLVIVKQIVHDLQCRLEEKADCPVRPCDVFDYIAGSGMGGVFAILFETFEYTVEQALDFYCKLHEQVFLSSHWKSKDKDETRNLLEATLLRFLPQDTLKNALVKKTKNPKCRALTCASNPDNITHPRLFRTYLSRQLNSPECSVLDAIMLSIVDNDHLEPYQLGQPAEDFSGSGHRFSNPATQVLREIHSIGGSECILSCIVSIGAGHPGSLKDEQLGAIVRDCVREADELGSRFAGTECLYFRLNVQQGLQVPLDRLGKIATQTNQYLSSTEVETVLTSLGEQLHRRPEVLSIGKIVAFVQDISFSEKKEMHQDIKHVRNAQDASILDQLEISKDARHDSAAAYKVQRRRCTVDTRVGILQQIESWARSVQYLLESSLFWIYGLAGTGKTTIMQTICEILDEAGLLASSYFCSTQLDSKESKRIFPTIARHLARHNSMFAQHLAAKLRDDPECAHAVLPVQFEELLCTPWRVACPHGIEPFVCVVAIDALDECDSNHGDEVLRLILDAVKTNQFQGLKFLITSRPVPTIIERAYGMKLGPQIALHEVSKMEVCNDVGRFLNEQLAGKLDPAYIRELTDRADGLFILASTLVKHLLPSRPLSWSERERRFERLLTPTQQDKKVGLDELYNQILNGALSSEELLKDELEYRSRILRAIACTAEPTSPQVIARLLDGTTVEDVMVVVQSLHSVLFVGTLEDPIYIIHASFQEFVTSQTDSSSKRSLSAIHATLAQSCLSHMQELLKFNICDIRSSFTQDGALNPPIRAIGSLLAYACQHWWGHYKQSNRNAQKAMLASIHRLIQEKGLFWIEAMSLLGHVRDCRDIFAEYASVSKNFQRSNKVQLLATEAVAMISLFVSMYPRTTSQLYLSLLPLWEGNIFSCWRAGFQNLPHVISRRIDGNRGCQLIIDAAASVNFIVFSSDGKRIISGTSSDVVEIWDAESGQLLAQLDGHRGSVNCVAVSRNVKRIVSGSDDKTIRIWDAESRQQLVRLTGHRGSVNCVAVSPDFKQVVSGSNDRTVRIWDAESGNQLRQHNGHEYSVASVAFSPDGRQVVSGSDDKTVGIWEVKSGIPLRLLNRHNKSVMSVAFSPDGKQLASGSEDRTVRIWNAESGRQLHVLTGHGKSVWSVGFSPDGKQVASSSQDKTLRIWDAKSGRQLRQFIGHDKSVLSIAFSPDGNQVASGSHDDTIRIWDVNSEQQQHQLHEFDNEVDSVVFSPDGKQIACGSGDMRIWDAKTGQQLLQVNGWGRYVRSIAFSPDSKRVLSGSDDQSVRIWDAGSGYQLRKLTGHESSVISVAFSPDGKQVVSGSYDKTVRIWDAESGNQLRQLNGHQSAVESVAFSPAGKRVASGSWDRSVRIWDTESGNQLRLLNGHKSSVSSVAFSPDGKEVVSGSGDCTVRIWDSEFGTQVRQIDGHDESVTSVAFSPDGKQVASGSSDRTVRIWNAQSGRKLFQLNGHKDRVLSVAFSPDGKRIASGSSDSTLWIWDVGPREFVAGSITSVRFLNRDELAPNPNLTLQYQRSRSLSLKPTTMFIYTRKDGWVVTLMEHVGFENRLFWLPPALRPFYPPVHLVISNGGFNKIDLSGCTFGEGWSKIYRGDY